MAIMDPLSQGLLGASAAQSFSKRPYLRLALVCGIIGGMAPDLDILFRSSVDPLFAIEYHRHFTHSLFFIPLGGALVALFLWGLFYRDKHPFSLVYFLTTIGYSTHGLLDASTSYGTLLFWPFSDYRVSLGLISIIDPIFTIILCVFVVLGIVRSSLRLSRVGLGLACVYLAYGGYNHYYAQQLIQNVAAERGHEITKHFMNPTIGNNILWRSVYQSGRVYYIDAVYVSPFSAPMIREGKYAMVIDPDTVFPELAADSLQREDIRRFDYFSKGFTHIYPDDPSIIADLRYGTLPYDNHSLWGIRVDPSKPDSHVSFGNLRKFSDRHFDEFWLMLQGDFTP